MTIIGSINGVYGAAPVGGVTTDARQAAQDTVGEIGHRVLSWVGVVGGGETGAVARWSGNTGHDSEFEPDAQELARGGDIYGLGALSSDLATRFGGTPAQEGGLRRSLEGFTRQAVVQIAGLSGGDPERQLGGLRDALGAVREAPAGDDVDGIAQRIDAGTAILSRQNGA